jgi:L-asparaginase II
VLAEVVRSGFVESRHRGSVAVIAADGQVVHAAGPAAEPVFPRSSNKPFQAAAMLRCGLKLDGELLALAAASHSGEDFHVAGVREILSSAGLTEGDLRCPPDMPLDQQASQAMMRAGAGPDRVHMNCSGKHAAMLATCVSAGWPTASYTHPQHPLQQEIRATIGRLAGAHPEWTSGTARPERALMAAVPGLLLKSGAEGVEGFALADGRAVAFKIEDGAARGRVPVTVAVLGWLGAELLPATDVATLRSLATVPVLGGGKVVGEIRPTAGLFG